MKKTGSKWTDWIRFRMLGQIIEEDLTEEEIYQRYKLFHENFAKNRNLNEAEVFDRVNLINESFKKLQNRLKKYYSIKDPGTSGDIAEIEISEFLKKIFPDNKIITKGIIRDDHGNLSPQIDILILDKDYPPGILPENTVYYESVLFAIECKLTLRKKELIKSLETARYLKKLGGDSINFLTTRQIKYGIFALSNEVRKRNKKIEEAVVEIIEENSTPDRPLELIDFIFVPNNYLIYNNIYVDDNPNLENPDFLFYIGQLEANVLNYPYGYPNDEPLGNFIYKTVRAMDRLCNRKSIWVEPNFGVFNTISSYSSKHFYQLLNEKEVSSILDGSVNEQNSKVELNLGRNYKERHRLK